MVALLPKGEGVPQSKRLIQLNQIAIHQILILNGDPDNRLKNVCMLVHSRHRSFDNFLMNVISVIAAYCFFDKKPAINMDFTVDGDQMLPTLF